MVILKAATRKRNDNLPRKISDTVNYIEGKRLHDGEKCLYAGYCNIDQEDAETTEMRIRTIEATAALNYRCNDPLFHDILSWQADEIPSKEQIEEALEIYIKEMGFADLQCVYGVHQNTNNIHLHIAVNRIHPETLQVIKPGMYKIKHEYIARSIELKQGWKQLNDGRFYKIINNEVVRLGKDKDNTEKAIDQNAKDYERRTGEKSAIRIAQNTALKNLWDVTENKITDWETLHIKLAERGFEIKKTGRGGILILHQDEEEIAIKLSSISQKVSMSKLENQLGEFQNPQKKLNVKKQLIKPLIDNNKDLSLYLDAKKSFYKERKSVISNLKNILLKEKKDEFKKLFQEQKNERKNLYGNKGKWKGKGKELNYQRSLMAAKHLSEKLALSSKYKEILNNLKEKKKMRFPDYCTWQIERNNEDAAWKFIYNKSYLGRITGSTGEFSPPGQKQFLKRYTTNWNTQKGVLNFYKDDKLAFKDTGKRINIVLDNDENIKDALLLASEKWGSITLYGTDDFKKKALNLAVKNNIKVTNPELQEMIEMKQEELKEAKEKASKIAIKAPHKVKEHINNFNTYAQLLETESFRITCVKLNEDGSNKSFLLKGINNQIDMHPYEIQAQWNEIEKLNNSGWNIYVTPIPEAAKKETYILVDDLSQNSLNEMKKDGFSPAVVIETSPENYQAIIVVERNFIENDEKAHSVNKKAANMLMKELNEVYGDKNIRAAIHPHRIPGMNNHKPKRIAENGGTAPEVKFVEINIDNKRNEINLNRTQNEQENKKIGTAVHCQLAQIRFNENIHNEWKLLKEEERLAAQAAKQRFSGNNATINPTDAFIIHAKDIIQHHGVTDYSRLDAEVALRMKATGYSTADIKDAIKSGSPIIRPPEKRNKQWENYAARTSKYTESFDCREKIRRHEHRIGAWLSLEGRTRKSKGMDR